MTDRQKLIYDLSLTAAACEIQRQHINGTTYLASKVLEEFVSSVRAYSCMDPSALDAALEALSAVKP